MIFDKKLTPDYYFDKFTDITPDFLQSEGFSAVVSDIDNTLATYDTLVPTEEIVTWVRRLQEAGIKVSLVSNNNRTRVKRFNEDLNIPAFYSALKPRTKWIFAAMEEMGSAQHETLFLGDQVLTDALAAHRANIKAAIVPPIKDKKSLFIKSKRLIEKPYMRKAIRYEKDAVNKRRKPPKNDFED